MKNLSKQELKIILLEQLLKNLNEMLKEQNPRKLVKDKIAFYVFNESKYPLIKLNGKLTINYKNNIKTFKINKNFLFVDDFKRLVKEKMILINKYNELKEKLEDKKAILNFYNNIKKYWQQPEKIKNLEEKLKNYYSLLNEYYSSNDENESLKIKNKMLEISSFFNKHFPGLKLNTISKEISEILKMKKQNITLEEFKNVKIKPLKEELNNLKRNFKQINNQYEQFISKIKNNYFKIYTKGKNITILDKITNKEEILKIAEKFIIDDKELDKLKNLSEKEIKQKILEKIDNNINKEILPTQNYFYNTLKLKILPEEAEYIEPLYNSLVEKPANLISEYIIDRYHKSKQAQENEILDKLKLDISPLNVKIELDKNSIKQKLKQAKENLPKEFIILEKNNDLSKINPDGILSNTIKMFDKQSMEENFTLVNS